MLDDVSPKQSQAILSAIDNHDLPKLERLLNLYCINKDTINGVSLYPASFSRDAKPFSLLSYAAFQGNLALVQYLVEVRLANINHADGSGNMPLHRLVQGEKAHLLAGKIEVEQFGQIAQYLLMSGALLCQNQAQLTPQQLLVPVSAHMSGWFCQHYLRNHNPLSSSQVKPVMDAWLGKPGRKPVICMKTEAMGFDLFQLKRKIETYLTCDKKANNHHIKTMLTEIAQLDQDSKVTLYQHIENSMTQLNATLRPPMLDFRIKDILSRSFCLALTATAMSYHQHRNIILAMITCCMVASTTTLLMLKWLVKPISPNSTHQQQKWDDIKSHLHEGLYDNIDDMDEDDQQREAQCDQSGTNLHTRQTYPALPGRARSITYPGF